jgi:hypothetical protein
MNTSCIRFARWAMALSTLLLAGTNLTAAPASDHTEELKTAQAAQIAYEQGMLLREADSEAAREAFEQSADGWRRLITAGHANARTWTNLGNAELGAGAVGESIVAYLEADRLTPGDQQVRTNLSAARNQVPARFDDTGVTVLYDTVSDGWHVLGFDIRWWIAAVCWIAFWAVLLIRINQRNNREDSDESEGGRLALRAALISLGGIAVIFAGTVALDVLEDDWRSPGVLVQESVVRSGNGASFSEVFSEALPSGVEFEVIESRPGWHRVRFADERTGWLRTDHVKVINS